MQQNFNGSRVLWSRSSRHVYFRFQSVTSQKRHMFRASELTGHAFYAKLPDRAILNCFVWVSIEINRNSNGSVNLEEIIILCFNVHSCKGLQGVLVPPLCKVEFVHCTLFWVENYDVVCVIWNCRSMFLGIFLSQRNLVSCFHHNRFYQDNFRESSMIF